MSRAEAIIQELLVLGVQADASLTTKQLEALLTETKEKLENQNNPENSGTPDEPPPAAKESGTPDEPPPAAKTTKKVAKKEPVVEEVDVIANYDFSHAGFKLNKKKGNKFKVPLSVYKALKLQGVMSLVE